MAEKSKGKRIPLQPGGRMLLGLSDEIHAMPYEDKESVLENMSTPGIVRFFQDATYYEEPPPEKRF